MIGRVLKGIFKTTEETGDKKSDPYLKTRYYKLSKERIWNEVIAVIEKMDGIHIEHQSKSIGEITVTHKGWVRSYSVTLTIVALSPIHISVDLFSTLKGPGVGWLPFGDYGTNYFLIVRLQKALDQALGTYRTA